MLDSLPLFRRHAAWRVTRHSSAESYQPFPPKGRAHLQVRNSSRNKVGGEIVIMDARNVIELIILILQVMIYILGM